MRLPTSRRTTSSTWRKSWAAERAQDRVADARVPAGRLRRRGNSRRVPCPRAAPSRRCLRPVLGIAERRARRDRSSAMGGALGAQAGVDRVASDVNQPRDGRRRQGCRPRPQPHLVRKLRRSPVEARLVGSACRDHAQPRAAPAMESRAAWGWLRDFQVLRADGDRISGRGDSRVKGNARRRAHVISECDSRPHPRDPQRDRRRGLQTKPFST